MTSWREADSVTLRWLIHLGGWRTAGELAEGMETTERFASIALLRLFWRGVLEIGPTKAMQTTWRVRPEMLEEA